MHNPLVGRVTSEYSPTRRHPVTGIVTQHWGIDIGAPAGVPPLSYIGTAVEAAYGGVVELVGFNVVRWRTGKQVVVRNDDGECQIYCHLDSIAVKRGQRVTKGQLLGGMGMTGNVTGPHLHFECHSAKSRAANGYSHPRNPRIDFNRHGITPGVATTTASSSSPPTPKKEWLDMVSENDLRRIIREETVTARWSYKGNQDRDAWAFLINGANAAVSARDQAVRNKNALEPITVNRSGNKSSHPLKTIISGLDTVARQNRARLAAIEEAIAQLSKAEGVELDYNKIEAAAQRGAEAAIAEGIEVEVVANASVKGDK